MRKRIILRSAAAAALTALAGCGDTSLASNQQQIKLRNEPHERLLALPDNLRRIGLMRAIRDTGNRCPLRVESARHQGEYRSMALWTARCDDNRQWAIFIAANDVVQVRNCEQMGRLDLPRCAELPEVDPNRSRGRPKAATKS